ncbi:MAG: hypothetical protein ACYTHJ_10180 [Planctomycetota bacterium]|jgi:tetratricopeptide (TPR) repeat protein
MSLLNRMEGDSSDHTAPGGADDTRPVGRLRPHETAAQAALEALDRAEKKSARRYLDQLDPAFGRQGAWHLLLQGELAFQSNDARRAAACFNQSFARAFVAATGSDGPFDAESMRLAALALVGVGRCYRRMDRAPDAERTHVSAYHLISLHGSHEELWEVRMELGKDAAVDGRLETAEGRYRAALSAGQSCHEAPQRKQADSTMLLSGVLADVGQWDEAVTMARRAVDLWRSFDVESSGYVKSRVELGSLLLRRGQSLLDDGDAAGSVTVIGEAVNLLSDARDELLALGDAGRLDAVLCGEQIDFAERLQAMCAVDEESG